MQPENDKPVEPQIPYEAPQLFEKRALHDVTLFTATVDPDAGTVDGFDG